MLESYASSLLSPTLPVEASCPLDSTIVAAPAQRNRPLRVFVATPRGLDGTGGIDSWTDAVCEAVASDPAAAVRLTRLTTRGNGSIFWSPLFLAASLLRLIAARLSGKVDVLHLNLASNGSTYRKLILARLASLLRLPYVVHLHGGAFDTFWAAAAPSLNRAIERLFQDSAGVVVLGRSWADLVQSRVPQVRSKLTILPNATPSQIERPSPSSDGRVRLTFLGELGVRKGTPEFIQALALVGGRSDWTATLAGDGAVESYRAQARELGISDRLTFTGWLGPRAKKKLLLHTDLLVLPSRAENLPMSIIEACSYGIPCVSTPVGATPEVIQDGRNGLLVPVGDVTALAQALEKLIGDPALRESFGAAALQAHSEHYELNGAIRKLSSFWEETAAC